MQFQVSTDSAITGSAQLHDKIEAELSDTLARFASRVTRIEVHLSDVNGPKQVGDDRHCTLEARIAGRQPVAVHHDAPSVMEAVGGAAEKMERSLERLFGKLRDQQGRTPASGHGDEAPE